MAGFQFGITNAGMELLTKGLAGSEIRFTGIRMGDGVPTGSLTAMTALASQKAELPITRMIRKSGQVTLKGMLRAGQAAQGFTWRELGLTAADPDTGAEVLYAYGYASDGDYIPGAGESTLDERAIQLTVLVAGAEQVTAQLDPTALYVDHDELEEVMAPLRGGAAATLSCTASGGVHALTGLGSRAGLVPCQFVAAADYKSGDSFTVDGVSYTAQLQSGSALPDGFFTAGAAVSALLQTEEQTVNFKAAGSGSPFPAGTTGLCAAFRQTGEWTVPHTGPYRLICIGRGGAGGNAKYASTNANPFASAGGGGSGAWCVKTLELQQGEVLTMTVSTLYSRVTRNGEVILEAGRGKNGTSASSGKGGAGGAGGTALYGDLNVDGASGESGTAAASGAVSGGNGAPMQSWEQLALYLDGSIGYGGLTENNASETGTNPVSYTLLGLSMGAGGGGGGVTSGGSVGSGGSGSPGCVLAEYAF